MSGKSEFAEGLTKAAWEALEDVTGLAKKAKKAKKKKPSLNLKKPENPTIKGVNRGAKHWSGNSLTWAPEDARPEATVEETRNLRKWVKKKGKSGQWEDTTPERNFETALRKDQVAQVVKVLNSKGWSWPRFVNQRVKLDPNLSKLTIKQRQKRAFELLQELGKEGFIKRFNL